MIYKAKKFRKKNIFIALTFVPNDILLIMLFIFQSRNILKSV